MKTHTSFEHTVFDKQNNLIPLLMGLTVTLVLLWSSQLIYDYKFERPSKHQIPFASVAQDTAPLMPVNDTLFTYIVPYNVKIKDYFPFLEDLKHSFDSIVPYELTEYVLVRSNPFIIDSLENTDYYRMKQRDVFVYDQKQLVILKEGTVLKIPTLEAVNTLKTKMERTRLDINIPEFKLRIIEGDDVLYTFPVRVGQNKKRYLAEVGREVNLKTRTGSGYIEATYKKDFYIDPVEGKKFTSTKRDDDKRTLMPLLPWLEPRINGELLGQLIHPTTNPASLYKPYSNGCIGTREADIWRIYYYAPIGTKVNIRYNLMVTDANGDTVRLKDIYNPKLLK